MGKAQVIESLGRGQYRIRLLLKRDEIIARIARYTAQICSINRELEIYTAECAEFWSGVSESSSSEQSKSSESESSYSGAGDPPVTFEEQSRINLLKLRKAAIQKKKTQLEALELEDPEITAWCADYTSTLAVGSDIGTIEVIRERGKGVNIEPGWEGNAVYSPVRDGQVESGIASTPAGLFYNLAMAPGSQKWKPTYRYGIITAINGSLCNVTLDAVKTGYYYKIENQEEPWLGVNQESSLIDVPFEYMDCNEVAFSVDDRVIVKFTDYDWSQPQVIGFESEPLPCQRFVYVHCFTRYTSLHPGTPSSAADIYRRAYAEMDPFTGELTWVDKADIEGDFNLADNWNMVMWRTWFGGSSSGYPACARDNQYAIPFYNSGYLQSLPPWGAVEMYSRAFTLPNGRMVFFSPTYCSINIFTQDGSAYILRNITRRKSVGRVTITDGAMFVTIAIPRLVAPYMFPWDDPRHEPKFHPANTPPFFYAYDYWEWPTW